jgi:hypothetical protein
VVADGTSGGVLGEDRGCFVESAAAVEDPGFCGRFSSFASMEMAFEA